VIGQSLGHYRIEEKLGEGGMGVVYRAHDTHLDRAVAIKVLRPDAVANPERKRRFVQEAKSASALNHPNIITVYDISNDGGTDYIAMEYVAGQSLDRLIGPGGLPLASALKYAAQVADALAAAHEAGIVHRDLKPGNVMITGKGHVKLVDFGLAKLTGPDAADDPSATRSQAPQTEEGAILGTVVYMSPEQAQGAKVDARSDRFSFGAMLYEMVTGRRPFSRRTPVETLTAILRDEPPPAGAGAELDRLIARCLEKNPAQRFQSTHDLAFALRALERGGAQTVSRRPGRRWRLAAAFAAAPLLAATSYWFLLHRAQPIDSLAVLPFVHAGGVPDTEYLSEGISESLITRLSRVPRLKVKSRDTVFQYKEQGKNVKLVGQELGVRAVLKGRLVQRGDSLTIIAELIDASDGTLLWRDQYNRRAADILTIEQEISREIAQQLRLKLTGEEQRRVAGSSTESPEAHRLYLQGRYQWNRLTEEALKKSTDYFQQAIDKDPSYAQAWAGLADSFIVLAMFSWMPPADAYPKARAAATRAIEIEDTLAEAHTSLARLKANYEWDWTGAEREFRLAIRLNPEYGTAHRWLAWHLAGLGRPLEGLAAMRRGSELDPLLPMPSASVGYFHIHLHQYEQAVEETRKAVEMDPGFSFSHAFLGVAYALQHKPKEATAELEQALHLSNRGLQALTLAGSSFAFLGKTAEAQKLLDELLDLSRKRYVAPYYPAMIYGSMGEKDRAFEYFEKALQGRDLLPWWLRNPELDGIRSDPRFQRMLQRMGLPP